MLTKVLELVGQVPRAGFKLNSGSELKIDAALGTCAELILTPNDYTRPPWDHKPKASLRSDGTDFLEFAALAPDDPQTVLTFANRFGPLGGWTKYPRTEPRAFVLGEPVEAWMREAADVREVVCVWRAWRRGDRAALKKRFRQARAEEAFIAHGLRGAGWAYFPPDGKPRFVGSSRDPIGGLEDAAGVWLRERVNGRIAQAEPRLTVDPENGGIVMGLMPRSLREALWLQLAFAVCGHQEYRECVVCGQPFAIDPDNGSNARRMYCGGSCRVTASRRRIEEAKKVKKPATKRKGK